MVLKAQPEVAIRALQRSDSITELTSLIRRAYKRLADMGLNFTGSYQSEEVTGERIAGGECYVAIATEAIVGTVLLYTTKQAWADGWYGREGIAIVGQFAVEPQLQSRGIGSSLMDIVERRASELGLAEVSLDTAEGATHLIDYYSKRGYRFVEYRQWDGKTYRSVIMSKRLIKVGSSGRAHL